MDIFITWNSEHNSYEKNFRQWIQSLRVFGTLMYLKPKTRHLKKMYSVIFMSQYLDRLWKGANFYFLLLYFAKKYINKLFHHFTMQKNIYWFTLFQQKLFAVICAFLDAWQSKSTKSDTRQSYIHSIVAKKKKITSSSTGTARHWK